MFNGVPFEALMVENSVTECIGAGAARIQSPCLCALIEIAALPVYSWF